MTNEEQLELIAQAREVCEGNLAHFQKKLRSDYCPKELRAYITENINSWTTHLAEIDEWSSFVSQVEAREAADPDYIANFYSIVDAARTQKLMLVTKAKRLLGVE